MHDIDDIRFAGASLKDALAKICDNVRILSIPTLNRPGRKQTVVDVAGRNGNVIIPQNAWNGISVVYDIYVKDCDIYDAASCVAEWLNKSGYQHLEDSLDANHYRLAYVESGANIKIAESINDEYITITFNCRPERFIKQPDIEITDIGTITNKSNHTAKPLIKVVGQGYRSLMKVNLLTRTLTGWYDKIPIIGVYCNYIYIGMGNRLLNGKFEGCPGFTNVSASDSTLKFTYTLDETYITTAVGVGIARDIKPNRTYTFSASFAQAQGDKLQLNTWLFKKDGTPIYSWTGLETVPGTKVQHTFKTPADAHFMIANFLPNSDGMNSRSYTISEIMLNEGAERLPYMPYAENTIVKITAQSMDKTVTLTTYELNDYFNIDCETEDIYREDSNLNNVSYFDQNGIPCECFDLPPGTTRFAAEGNNYSKLVIEPRLWNL